MSPHVGNFVQDLVEMAKAVEQVPILQAELNETVKGLENALSHNQGLESNIIGYKAQIEDLQAKVRSLEVERDDASFRVLEAEDRENGILLLARNMQNDLAVIMNRLDPPKPQPEPEVLPQATELSQVNDTSGYHPEHINDPNLPQGESVTDPTPIANDGEMKSDQTSVTSSATTDVTLDKEDKEPTDKYSDAWYDWRAREDKRQGYHRF